MVISYLDSGTVSEWRTITDEQKTGLYNAHYIRCVQQRPTMSDQQPGRRAGVAETPAPELQSWLENTLC